MTDTKVSLDVTQNMRLADLLKQSADILNASSMLDSNDGHTETLIMFQHVSGKSRSWILINEGNFVKNLLSSDSIDTFLKAIAQRASGIPVAYILGNQYFWSLDLEVNESTLIPRQDTELLIESVLDLPIPITSKVLDLGTGTGAIALALAKEKKDWEIMGVDRISDAVDLAKRNARRNHVKVSFYVSHWYEWLDDRNETSVNCQSMTQKFDLIVSNPPYVEPDSEYLTKGDLRFEPNSALIANNEGLADIIHIVKYAPKYLQKNGYLALEHGFNQGEAVRNLLVKNGFFNVETKNDYNQLPRVSIGQLQN